MEKGTIQPLVERRSRRVRSMRTWFCVFWLVLLVGVTGMLAVGGQPDPAGLGRALDGPWRFHAGDNPGWADPGIDDRNWESVTLVSKPEVHDGDVGIPGYLDGWRAHGHPGLDGYGWYRRDVTLPQRGDVVLIGPPIVDDGYQAFWNGHPIGGIGDLSGPPSVSGTRPALMKLPAGQGRTGLLAIRAYMQPDPDRDDVSGGLRTVPFLATAANGEALYRAQWRRTIAGYVVDAAEPVAMLVLAGVALLSAPALRRPAFARWAALALVTSAGLRLGNAITAWSDLVNLPMLGWQNGIILAPLAKLAWTLAWNAWADGRDRRWVSLAAVAAWVALVVGALTQNHLLDSAGRAVFALSLAAIAIRVARHGEHRLLVLPAMLLTTTGLFAADLSALGVPGIWFPFEIGVSRSQYAYALLLPFLACAIAVAVKSSGEMGHERERV